jgi:hypothetical protein
MMPKVAKPQMVPDLRERLPHAIVIHPVNSFRAEIDHSAGMWIRLLAPMLALLGAGMAVSAAQFVHEHATAANTDSDFAVPVVEPGSAGEDQECHLDHYSLAATCVSLVPCRVAPATHPQVRAFLRHALYVPDEPPKHLG